MKSKNILKALRAVLLVSLSALYAQSHATSYIVSNTTLSIYAQSQSESSAHLIRSSKGIYNEGEHPWCKNRAYIELADTALFATALAAAMSGKPVNFIYEDAAPQRNAAGHISFGCKVTSIFQ